MIGPRHIMIEKVTWWWYLVPIIPIFAVEALAMLKAAA
jgi:hypothetical protein